MRYFLATTAAIPLLLLGCGDASPAKPAPTPEVMAVKIDPNDPQFKERVRLQLEEMEKEESVREEAPWFGKTGLTDETERRLPRYLRREFGLLLSQPGTLRAQDLEYVGAFAQGTETVRYWRIHYGSPEPKFAYVVSGPEDRQFTGWGDRAPPK